MNNLYKKEAFSYFHIEIIDSIFNNIVNSLNKENIQIIDQKIFYNSLVNYIYKTSFTAIKSKYQSIDNSNYLI